ncbi:MAG: hypothetical protein ACTSU5_12005 [Promethearchaeota archaeon]
MFYIAFDESHKPRGKITSNYRNLQRHLEATGNFQCFSYLEFPITRTTLNQYDILVLPCPDFSKLSPQEISEINKWVREDGGGLLMLSHAGGDKGRNSNLSELAERFGMVFESDQVLDEEHNFGMDNLPEIKDFHPSHPVVEGIESICFRAGCSLTVVGMAIAVASTGETADPFSTPIIVAADCDEGRVIGCGSYEIFRDRIGGGFNHGQHSQLAENFFNWLVTDCRRQFRSGQSSTEPQAIPSGNISVGPLYSGEESQVGSLGGGPAAGATPGEVEVISRIHIGDRSEFGIELARFLLDFQKLQSRLEALIKAVMTTPDIQEAGAPAAGAGGLPTAEDFAALSASAPPSVGAPEPAEPMEPFPPAFTPPPAEVPPGEEPEVTLTPPPEPPALTPPPEPPVLTPPPEPPMGEPVGGAYESDGATVDAVAGEVDSGFVAGPPVEAAAPEPEEPEIDVDALQTELEGLKSKLISINDLKKFVDKKRAGGMDEAAYQKQVKKLESDTKKTQYRIDEIEALLKKAKK